MSAAAIRVMLAKGLTIDQALIAVEAMEGAAKAATFAAEDEKRAHARAGNRDRQAKFRAARNANNAGNAVTSVTGVTPIFTKENNVSNADNGVTDVTPPADPRVRVLNGEELRDIPPNEPNGSSPASVAKPRKQRAFRGEPEFIRAELGKVLDASHVDAVYAYRLAKKAVQSGYAARLLAEELAKTGVPNHAADLMILRNWQGFKLGWWEREQSEQAPNPRAQGPPNGHAPPRPAAKSVYMQACINEANRGEPGNFDDEVPNETPAADASGGGSRAVSWPSRAR